MTETGRKVVARLTKPEGTSLSTNVYLWSQPVLAGGRSNALRADVDLHDLNVGNP